MERHVHYSCGILSQVWRPHEGYIQAQPSRDLRYLFVLG